MSGITKAEREARKALFTEGLKRCLKCLEVLPIDRFHSNTRGWMGLHSQCRGCKNAAAADYQRRNPEAAARRMRHWVAANPIRARLIWGAAKARTAGAPVEEIAVDHLLADWEHRGINPDRCVYCGGEFEELEHIVPLSQPNTPGHVMSNVAPACARCNQSKGPKHWLDYLADRAEAGNLKENAA